MTKRTLTPEGVRDQLRASFPSPRAASVFRSLQEDLLLAYSDLELLISWWGTSEERLKLLRDTAAFTFRRLRVVIAHDLELRVARILDLAGKDGRKNASLEGLIELLPDFSADEKAALLEGLAAARTRAKKTRARRNKLIAHRDLDAIDSEQEKALAGLTRRETEDLLQDLTVLLDAVERRYIKATTYYRKIAAHGGPEHLIFYLERGLASVLREREDQLGRLRRGRAPEENPGLS